MSNPSPPARSPSVHGEADAAEITARILLETESVLFRPEDPFTFTSGLRSPVYIDCRRLISFPRARKKLMDMAAELIERHIGFESLDAIAGGETAGIPFAAWIADRLSLPMLYVRKQPKGFGRNAQIEGELRDERACCWSRTSPPTAPPSSISSGDPPGRRPHRPRLRDLPLRHLPADRDAACRPRASSCRRSPPGGTWRKPPNASAASPRANTKRSKAS